METPPGLVIDGMPPLLGGADVAVDKVALLGGSRQVLLQGRKSVLVTFDADQTLDAKALGQGR